MILMSETSVSEASGSAVLDTGAAVRMKVRKCSVLKMKPDGNQLLSVLVSRDL